MATAQTHTVTHICPGLFPVGRPLLLVVEESRDLRGLLDDVGVRRQFSLNYVDSGKIALRRMHARLPRLVVIDAEMSEATGFDLCASIKSSFLTRHVPVILVGAGGDAEEARSMDSGADDYLRKPSALSLLLAKANACIRASEQQFIHSPQPLRVHDLMIDASRRCVFVGRRKIELAIYQLQLVMALASAPGRIFTHDELAIVLGFPDVEGNYQKLRFHVCSLRKRLGRAGALVETVVGRGYRLKMTANGTAHIASGDTAE